MAISVGDLEAVLRLRDELSSQVRGAAQATQQAARDVTAATKQIEQSVAATGASFQAFGVKVSGVSEQSRKTLGDLEKQFASARESMAATGARLDDMAQRTAVTAQKQELLGKAVATAGKVIATYFGAQAIVGAIRNTVAWASHIEDVSQKLGTTSEMTQRLSAAAKQSGTSIDTVSAAMGILSQKLTHGEQGVVENLEKLGLTLDDLRSKSPEQALLAVGRSIGDLSSKQQQLAVSRDLLGRSGTDLIPMFKDLDGAMRSVAVATDEQIAAADALGDSWDALMVTGKALIAAGLSMVTSSKDGAREAASWAQEAIDLAEAVSRSKEAMSQAVPWYQDLGMLATLNQTRMFQLTAEIYDQIQAYRTLAALPPLPKTPTFGATVRGSSGVPFGAPPTLHEERLLEESSRKLQQKIDKDAREVTEGFKRYFERWNEETKKALGDAGVAIMKFALMMQQLPTSPETKALQRLAMGIDSRTQPGILQNLVAPLTLAGQEMIRGLMGGPGAVSRGSGDEGFLLGLQGRGLSVGESLFGRSVGGKRQGGFVADLPSTILGAIQGGGSVVSAIGSSFGSALFGENTALTKSATKGLSSLFGDTIGGALGSVIPGLGALLGPAITGLGKVIGNLFGGEGKRTNRARDAAISEFTGISGDKGASQAAFRDMATAAGVAASEIDRLFSVSKQKDFEAGFKRITEEIEKSNEVLQRYGVTWEDFQGAERAKRFGAEIEKLVEDTKILEAAGLSHETALKKQEEAYLDLALAAVRAGEEITPALAGPIKQLAEMGRITKEQADILLGLADSTVVDFRRMEEVAQKYGIEISALGPRFQEAKLGFSANETIRDFEFLIDAGADVNGVLAGMTDELQALVKQSLEFGIALPDAMRPVLQRLVEQGELTDASGEKLTDLSQLKFAAPIEDSIQRLIDKMGELIDRIGGVGEALSDLPPITGTIPDPGVFELPPGVQTAGSFAGGTHGRYLNFGGGTPVMLHGRERVMTEAEGDSSAGVIAEVRALRSDLGWLRSSLPIALRDAVLLTR